MWGAFILVSFAMLDFNLRAAFLLFATGAAARRGERAHQRDARAAAWARWTAAADACIGMYWGTIFLGMLALAAARRQTSRDRRGCRQVSTLIVGIVYFLAGVHLDRRWMPSGLVLIIGSAAITFVPRYRGRCWASS